MATDFRKFELELDAFCKKVEQSAATVTKRVAFDLFRRIVRKTPVDTGRARAAWNMSVNEAHRTVPPEGQASYPEPTAGALVVQPGDEIWISNNLPYIVKLEEGGYTKKKETGKTKGGFSLQAPHGMVAVSIEEVKLQMNRLIAEGLKDAGL